MGHGSRSTPAAPTIYRHIFRTEPARDEASELRTVSEAYWLVHAGANWWVGALPLAL